MILKKTGENSALTLLGGILYGITMGGVLAIFVSLLSQYFAISSHFFRLRLILACSW